MLSVAVQSITQGSTQTETRRITKKQKYAQEVLVREYKGKACCDVNCGQPLFHALLVTDVMMS